MIEYFHRVALIGIVLNVIVSALIALLGVTAATLACSLWNADLAALLATLTHRITDATIASSALALRCPELSFRVRIIPAQVRSFTSPIGSPSYISPIGSMRGIRLTVLTLPPTDPFARASMDPLRSVEMGSLGLHVRLPAEPRPPDRPSCHALSSEGMAPCPLPRRRDTGTQRSSNSPMGRRCSWMPVERSALFLQALLPPRERSPRARSLNSSKTVRRLARPSSPPSSGPRGLTRVDYLVPTHAHADHMRGFLDVVRNFEIGAVLLVRRPVRDPLFMTFLCAVEQRRIPIIELQQGDRLWIGPPSAPSAMATVLWPPPVPQPESWGNEDSLVLRLQYGEISILFPGDIERASEKCSWPPAKTCGAMS
jgi:hypothetical protein